MLILSEFLPCRRRDNRDAWRTLLRVSTRVIEMHVHKVKDFQFSVICYL